MKNDPHIAILGGGPAGLAAGLYAQRHSLPFELFEASADIGGNCRTVRFGQFLVDTGAHRLHARDADMMTIARELLGDDLLKVNAPSQLFHGGRLIDFPLNSLSLLRQLPLSTVATIAWENIVLRLRRTTPEPNFGSVARSLYGRTLASLALLNYSRKLWGRNPDELLPEIAGSRLSRLDLRSFVAETLRGRNAAREHLDGEFYYPRLGIGQFFDSIGRVMQDRIHVSSPVTRLEHENNRIVSVEAAGASAHEFSHVINTLPLGLTAELMSPEPPASVLDSARSIKYRHLRLYVLIVSRNQLTDNASIYFPDPSIPFTRLYESKNRSAAMAPRGATALVLEIPFESDGEDSQADSRETWGSVLAALAASFGLRADEVIERHELTIPNAYPILETAAVASVATLRRYLESFTNMSLVGRNARFEYSSIHDLFRSSRDAIESIVS